MRSSATCIKRQTLLYIQKLRHGNFHVTFPIYDPSTPDSVAWERLISTIASAKMEFNDISYERDFTHFDRTTTIQLLYLFPHPSRQYWFPSWAQVQQYPEYYFSSILSLARLILSGKPTSCCTKEDSRIWRGSWKSQAIQGFRSACCKGAVHAPQ